MATNKEGKRNGYHKKRETEGTWGNRGHWNKAYNSKMKEKEIEKKFVKRPSMEDRRRMGGRGEERCKTLEKSWSSKGQMVDLGRKRKKLERARLNRHMRPTHSRGRMFVYS